MSYTPLHHSLSELGLNKKEIAIYLALLSLGSAPASVLGRLTNIKRPTAAYTCQQLHKKGLLSMVQKGETYWFSYESPQQLKLLLQKQCEALAQKEIQMHRVVQTLETMIPSQTVLPKVQFFEGAESIAQAYEKVLDDLEEGDEIVGFVKTLEEGEGPKSLARTLDAFIKKRIQKKVFYRFIASATPAALQLKANDAQYHRETRLIPANSFPVTGSEIVIYKNKVYSMTFEQEVVLATIVESKSLTEIQRGIFWALWNNLENNT